MSTDPLELKYPNISSYCYSLNNALSFLDANGDSIQIREFVNNNWKVYTFNLADKKFQGKDGKSYVGDNSNVSKTAEALSMLLSKDAGGELVKMLSNSEKKVLINAGDGLNNNEMNGSQGFDSYVRWDPNKEAAFGGSSFVTLGHELAHSLDRINGTLDDGTWFIAPLPDGTSKHVPNAEIYSTHFENRIRKEHGLNLRSHYSIDVMGNPSGNRILDKDNRSLYFDKGGMHHKGYGKIPKEERYIYK